MGSARTVLITGGNRGIGFAIAEEFLTLGHRVAVTARSGQGPDGSLTVRADVTDAASIDAAFSAVEAAYAAKRLRSTSTMLTRPPLASPTSRRATAASTSWSRTPASPKTHCCCG